MGITGLIVGAALLNCAVVVVWAILMILIWC